MKIRIILASLAVAVIAVSGWLVLQEQPQSPTPHRATAVNSPPPRAAQPATPLRPADAARRSVRPSPAQLKARYESFMAHRPAYLDNIDLPGRYSVDDEGNLVVDAGLKEMLDFFLQTIGDLPFDEIHDLIAGSMIAALQEPALSQALALLDDYFLYLDAYDQWQHGFDRQDLIANDPAALRDRLQALSELRRHYLGDEVHEVFFGELEQVNNAYLDAQIALQQPNLSPAEKLEIRQQLKAALPPQVREAQEAAMTLVTLTETTKMLQAQGADEQQIFRARAALVGEEAAMRLAQVDEEKRIWAQKRNQYKQLLETPGLAGMTESEKSDYIADLAQQQLGLSSNEIRRMQALDRIEAADSPE